jgi:hypothetical protein
VRNLAPHSAKKKAERKNSGDRGNSAEQGNNINGELVLDVHKECEEEHNESACERCNGIGRSETTETQS